MAIHLVETVRGIFSNDLIAQAASKLGENGTSLKQAVNGVVPSVLTGILNKAASGDVQGLLGLAKNAASSFAPDKLGTLISGGESMLSKGADMLKGLFGDRTANVVSTISSFAGIKESSAASLMNLAAPAALGVVGKQVVDTRADASGLLSLLNSQKDSILSAMPSGLNLAGALGLGSLAGIGTKLTGALSGIKPGAKEATAKITHMAESAAEKTAGGMRWLLPLLLVVLVIGLIWYFMKGRKPEESSTVVVADTTTKKADTAAIATQPSMEMLKVMLPNGVELDAYKGGIEDQLVHFLNDSSSKAGQDVWFDFDQLNFKINSSEVTDESQKQVQNITAILKSFPRVKIKIGGYTDRTGDSVANMKLSDARAKSVLAALITSGANTGQLIGAEGYGSRFAKSPADAPDEERKKDRRISISVRSK